MISDDYIKNRLNTLKHLIKNTRSKWTDYNRQTLYRTKEKKLYKNIVGEWEEVNLNELDFNEIEYFIEKIRFYKKEWEY